MAETVLESVQAVTAVGVEHGDREGGTEHVAEILAVDVAEVRAVATGMFRAFDSTGSLSDEDLDPFIRIFTNAFLSGVRWERSRG